MREARTHDGGVGTYLFGLNGGALCCREGVGDHLVQLVLCDDLGLVWLTGRLAVLGALCGVQCGWLCG